MARLELHAAFADGGRFLRQVNWYELNTRDPAKLAQEFAARYWKAARTSGSA